MGKGEQSDDVCPTPMASAAGKLNGVAMSVISIGMGAPMMDFMVRYAPKFPCPGLPSHIISRGGRG